MAAILVAFLAFGLYAVTASPAMGWLDSPEIVAAAASLGVPHSPGHPLPVLAGRLGTLLPVGDMAFRVSLISALASAGAAVMALAAGRRILARAATALPRMLREVAAAAAALVHALSWSAWCQGTRAEVYALAALLCSAALVLVLDVLDSPTRARTGRALLAAGLIMGLALATHHFIALTVFVPAAIMVLVCQRPGVRRSALVAALGILGLAALLYLPVRAARYPVVNWGVPDTAERLVWTVSAQAFHKATTKERISAPAEDLAQAVATLADQATWPLALLALLGLYAGLRQPGVRGPVLLLAGIAGLGVGGRVLIGFDAATPDDHGYLLPALSAVILLGLAGLGIVAQQLARTQGRLAGAILCGAAVLVPWQLGRTAPQVSMGHVSDELAHWELDELPPRTLLVSAYFQTSFRLWALRATEQARPDMDILDRSFLTYPGMAEAARRAQPALARLIDAPLRAGVPLPVALLTELARTRPVRVQLHPNLDAGADPWLLPDGPFAALVPEVPGPVEREQAERRDDLARRDLARRLSAAQPAEQELARAALLWHDVMRLELFCRQGRLQSARQTLDHARALAPDDPVLHDLASRCRLEMP